MVYLAESAQARRVLLVRAPLLAVDGLDLQPQRRDRLVVDARLQREREREREREGGRGQREKATG